MRRKKKLFNLKRMFQHLTQSFSPLIGELRCHSTKFKCYIILSRDPRGARHPDSAKYGQPNERYYFEYGYVAGRL